VKTTFFITTAIEALHIESEYEVNRLEAAFFGHFCPCRKMPLLENSLADFGVD